MATKVINIRQSKKISDEVYIGRPGKGQEGVFGNPVVIGKQCQYCKETHNDGGSTLICYESYLLKRLADDHVFAERFWQLKDKTLVCFCRPKDGFNKQVICHGQIMAGILDSVPPHDIS